MDEGSVFPGVEESDSGVFDSSDSRLLHISAVCGAPSTLDVQGSRRVTSNFPAKADTSTLHHLMNAPRRHASRSTQVPPTTPAKLAVVTSSNATPIVEVVTSPIHLPVTEEEEVRLDRVGVSLPRAFRQDENPTTPPARTVAPSRSTPLVPDNRHVVKGASFPQPLQRSQLNAAPTGGSDSDSDGASATNALDVADTDQQHSHQGNDSLTDGEERANEQQFVDEFGFVIDEDAKQKDERYIRHIDWKQVVRREIKWANMASDWNRTNTKMHAKLKERCRKGIPSRFRGVAWQLMLGSFHQLTSEENNGVYAALRDKILADKDTDAIISRDLARTFPHHILFQDSGGAGQTFLRNVLHAYAGCDPEVGYVQGMGFLVAALSTQMAEEESFWALYEMMYNERYKMRELFRPGFPLLQQFFFQLKRLMARLIPRLSKRLVELDIQPSFFAAQWFLTLFVSHFPFRALLRVWDIFFSEGWKIIFRTGIALMKWEEPRLLKLPFDELLPALKTLQDGKDARELLHRAHRIKFRTAELNSYADEYWEMMGVVHRN